MRNKYDKALLEKICERDSCIIDYNTIKKYNSSKKIDFICNCGNYGSKYFSCMYKNGGGYCKDCTLVNNKIKIKQTNLYNYIIIYKWLLPNTHFYIPKKIKQNYLHL
jgi:hypothetical protein